jgi:flagellar basal-body rod protein FlgF
MNYSMQLSASGVLSNLYRMDVLANNLANATTTAFKPDLPMVRQRDAARVEDGLGLMPSNALLERLGGGVTPVANQISWEQGTLTSTGNPFDLAVEGEGLFVLRERSELGTDRLRLTRDGRFTRNDGGWLVSATNGLPALDVANRPIRIPGEGPIQVDADGTIRQNGVELARIQLARVDTTGLSKLGHGMFQATSEALSSRRPASGIIRQNTLEGSGVDAIATMMALTDAGRAAETNFGLIQNADRIMDRAINGLGRVVA